MVTIAGLDILVSERLASGLHWSKVVMLLLGACGKAGRRFR
jgi:hypothetical protein